MCVHYYNHVCESACDLERVGMFNEPMVSSDEEWEIDQNLLQLGRVLGSGRFGVSLTKSCVHTFV